MKNEMHEVLSMDYKTDEIPEQLRVRKHMADSHYKIFYER
jgi:hypothetical protein